MSFGSDYLLTGTLFPKLINDAPEKDTGIIVVIPAYDEPHITITLDSLAACIRPDCKVEVLIIVNAPADSSPEGLNNNDLTIEKLKSWKSLHNECFFRLYYFNAGQPDISNWGVGLARKTGMDEATRRFDIVNNPAGVIASLDADCRVDKNYFICLTNELYKRDDRKACSVYFEHPVDGELSSVLYKAIVLYELHLRYYFQALKYTGFPYVHHTIGSAIAIKASAYVKAGGMNRRQAGEDFYFIQKLVPAGGFFNLCGTTVYPSPRISLRVPFFSTGIAVGKLLEMETPEYYTYDFKAFQELQKLFSITQSLFKKETEILKNEYFDLPENMKQFIPEVEWLNKLRELNGNTSTIDSFIKRFFGWFNMIKVVKYLNYVHTAGYAKKGIVAEAKALLDFTGYSVASDDPEELLMCYRALEKDASCFPC